MRVCSCCGRGVDLTEASRPRSVVYADSLDAPPFMYLLIFECRCQNTMSLVLWQNEECTAEELGCDAHEQAGAEQYEREEAPLDRATYRPFFSLTHELAERGL